MLFRSLIKEIVRKEAIECDMKDIPTYLYETNNKKVIDEAIIASKRLGAVVSEDNDLPFVLESIAAMKYEESSSFNVMRYLTELAGVIVEHGVLLLDRVHVTSLEQGSGMTLTLDTGKQLLANKVVITSDIPLYEGIQEQVAVLQVEASKMPTGSYLSLQKPAWSIHPLPQQNMVMISGEVSSLEEILDFGERLFETREVIDHWAYRRVNTEDGMPYVGRLEESKYPQLYVATGYNKWGTADAIGASIILEELLSGKYSENADLFHPRRFMRESMC